MTRGSSPAGPGGTRCPRRTRRPPIATPPTPPQIGEKSHTPLHAGSIMSPMSTTAAPPADHPERDTKPGAERPPPNTLHQIAPSASRRTSPLLRPHHRPLHRHRPAHLTLISSARWIGSGTDVAARSRSRIRPASRFATILVSARRSTSTRPVGRSAAGPAAPEGAVRPQRRRPGRPFDSSSTRSIATPVMQ